MTLTVSLLTLLIITVLSIAAYIEFEESLLENTDTTMRYMGETLCAELVEEGVSPENHEAAFRAITGHSISDHASRCRIWMDGSDDDLFSTDSAGAPLAPGLRHPPVEERPEVGGSCVFNIAEQTGVREHHPLRVMWMRHLFRGQVVNILVGRSSGQVYQELGEFLQLLLVSGGSILLTVMFLVPRIISWALRPVTDAGRRMKRITHRNLGQDSPIQGNVPAELQPFQEALDGMFARLNAAMRQQEQFTADAAHDLRTPLAVMKSTLQTLQIRPRTVAEYQESVNDLLRDIDRMERLVQQLLTLARLDAADKVSDPTEVRLDLLLQSVADTFRGRAEQQGTHLVCEPGATLSVEGNETELRQLFSNLLDNALRYGPPNGEVRISLKNGPDSRVATCVHDEGGAIPPDKLPRLFDRFYRVETSRSEAFGGTGLGLAIAREIALRHGGDIAVTSDPQAGTSVIVRLPRS
ncbi:MAG: HAMP domain-containing sensor histidine kinase [Phycisphaerales bacterium]